MTSVITQISRFHPARHSSLVTHSVSKFTDRAADAFHKGLEAVVTSYQREDMGHVGLQATLRDPKRDTALDTLAHPSRGPRAWTCFS